MKALSLPYLLVIRTPLPAADHGRLAHWRTFANTPGAGKYKFFQAASAFTRHRYAGKCVPILRTIANLEGGVVVVGSGPHVGFCLPARQRQPPNKTQHHFPTFRTAKLHYDGPRSQQWWSIMKRRKNARGRDLRAPWLVG